jgi:hypothetical protein
VALAITFEDRAAPELEGLVRRYADTLNIPVALVNARSMTPGQRHRLLSAIQQATPLATPPAVRTPLLLLPAAPVVAAQHTLFEQPRLAPWLALLAMTVIFAAPVYLAYRLADWVQPLVDGWAISPLVATLAPWAEAAPLIFAILAGDYGLITLGWYSFLWACPVVCRCTGLGPAADYHGYDRDSIRPGTPLGLL